MRNAFNIAKEIYSIISYKGLPFPGAWIPQGKQAPQNTTFEYDGEAHELKTHADLGATLRKKDALGRWYFMPVVITHNGKDYEIPNAVIGVTAFKNIVETPMVGRRGTVKELININDYQIDIAGAAISSDFPEQELKALCELFEINEAVELKCALTDLFMTDDDRIVIKEMRFAEMKGTETIQTVELSAVTDRSFELIIE